MFKIGEFSKVSNITVRTLRHYEKVGLLLPSKVDQQSGYRYYKAEQLGVLNQIKLLQQVGLSLESIKEILRSQDLSVLNYYYELREQEIHLELETLNAKKQLVEELKKQLKEGVSMEKYNVVKKQLAVRNVMSIRKVIPSFSDEGQLWNKLYLEAQKQQVKFSNQPSGISIYHDKEYQEANVDVEVQSEVIGKYKDTEEATFFEAPAVEIASVTFHGSFDQMSLVSQALATWIDANGYKISGPMMNISHVSPAEDPNPDHWINEVAFVVEKN
ncbi:MerR family transcriptional regulator [Enterococcus rivorum]|uniref:HTH merR-type domain-containing protein n=1 Tax=Enterococcus rivorum TaxID=762845 RepID=A0A1E5KWW2_9ENTE|nr:MerR family transcriptional regulator [Enterococcus rivorum]MBP2097288.1 DNA-binding transcriptional MerR regulator [Enterococcus rivorum]OEH82360.1 hypothetical protein BCR26_02715 [Enterococcus rivorum]